MDYSRYHSLSCERQGKVLIVSLNRPEALNAVNAELHTELAHVFADIALDQETNVVVLTGKGRAFSAGGDIKWFQDMTPPQLEDWARDARNRERGVGDFETLLQACIELGARFIVCEMGLRSLAIDRNSLRSDVPFTVAGIVTLLEETKPGMHLLTL